MRWIWFDRFEEFESGRWARAVKNITLAEDYLHEHFPGLPLMPASLMIEGMAQTAGILVGEARDFSEKVILAKIQRAVFHALARPGDQLHYEARLEHLSAAAAATTGRITRGPELVGEVDLVFSHLDQNISGLAFPQENFVFTDEFKTLLAAFRRDPSARIQL